jgi:hypothetical protein
MPSRRKILLKSKGFTSTVSSDNTIYVLNDNLSDEAANTISGDNITVLKADDLGLTRAAEDGILLRKFDEAATTAGATAWIMTSDRGKGDKIMPQILKRYSNILQFVSSIKGTNAAVAIKALGNIQGFKRKEKYSEMYLKIHLQQMGSTLRIKFVRKNLTEGVKDIPNVFK